MFLLLLGARLSVANSGGRAGGVKGFRREQRLQLDAGEDEENTWQRKPEETCMEA